MQTALPALASKLLGLSTDRSLTRRGICKRAVAHSLTSMAGGYADLMKRTLTLTADGLPLALLSKRSAAGLED